MDMQKGETEKLNEEESFNDKNFEVVLQADFNIFFSFVRFFNSFYLKLS